MYTTAPVLFIFSRKILLIWRWNFNNWRIEIQNKKGLLQ
jgi:hypothetical protein